MSEENKTDKSEKKPSSCIYEESTLLFSEAADNEPVPNALLENTLVNELRNEQNVPNAVERESKKRYSVLEDYIVLKVETDANLHVNVTILGKLLNRSFYSVRYRIKF